jgi:16S rRNA (guanine1207-N2)-methyltransferase
MPRIDRLAFAFQTGALAPPESGPIVWLRAEPGGLGGSLDPARLVCEQSFRPDHDALTAEGATVTARAEGPAAMVLVSLTRQRAENLGNVARGLAMLPEGGTLAIGGARTDGIDSLARTVGAALPLAGTLPKAHGKVVWLNRPARLPAAVEPWAAEYAPRRNADGFVTAPGMFSPEHVDTGSATLARFLGGGLAGRCADLGAGWGWLAAQALAAGPAIERLDLYEAEARALDAARANVADSRAAFHWADVARLGRDAGPYDRVIANPPFHRGRTAEAELGAAFIAAAARILKPSGRLLMVANRQLPYERPLAAAFRAVEKLHEDAAFKVLAAERPLRR